MAHADVLEKFRQQGGLVRAGKLKEAGLHYPALRRMIATGQVEKINRGLYRLTSVPYNEKAEIARLIPGGVFCLFTALQHYGLSTFVPPELHVAIPRKSKYVLPAYPPVKLYYWDKASYETGITQVSVEGASIQMYDLEKTVCDVMRLRNKIGLDIAKEVMKNYLTRKGRDLVKLLQYARLLRVESTVKTYLHILL